MLDLFQTLMRPDHEDQGDKERAVVSQASNILQVGEFQVLQLAYFEWHGEDLPETRVDGIFTDYMMRGIVPVWARHYARNILELERTGRLDYRDFSYHRYDYEFVIHVEDGKKQFFKFASILGILIFGAIGFSAAITANKSGSILPPYFSDDDFQKNKKTIPLP
jgi:hypothetical protein